MHPIYSVKLRNVTWAASTKKKLQASYFPYDRFYLFHSEDLASGLVDRMFYVYLLHRYSDELKGFMDAHITLENIDTINKSSKKTSEVKDADSSNSRVTWHIKEFDKYVMVVPSFSRQVTEVREPGVQHSAGYVTSKAFSMDLEQLFPIPELIVYKENLRHPCAFCERYLEGFQEGLCHFGGVACRAKCRLYLPKQRLEIVIGDEEDGARLLDNNPSKIPD
jgi:hypothetical protein